MGVPSSQIIQRQSPPSRSQPIQSGTWFAIGLADRGPTDEVADARNLQQFVDRGGDRVSYGELYDAADVFFREGGSKFKWVRVVGPDAKNANKNIANGAAENTLKAIAINAGAWANDLTVEVAAGETAGSYVITIKEGSTAVEVSPELVDNEAAVAWAETSDYIRLEDLAKGDPKAGEYKLAEGDDDRENITEEEWEAALAVIKKSEGPGQVSAPGRTTTASHEALLEHADANNRVAILDTTDTSTVETLLTLAATDRDVTEAAKGGLFGSWFVVPGVAPGTTRTVPPSCVEAGIIARNATAGLSPNIAAAGDRYGQSRYAIELAQPAFSDEDHETLFNAGINLAEERGGVPTNMGFRTLVSATVDDTWLLLSNARLYMEIAANADAIAAKYLFEQIDGKGITFAKFNGELRGMLLPYFSEGSLYGDTFDEAAFVDTGEQVNTKETIADRQINAVIELRMSPFGETVTIYVSKVATTEAV